MQNVIEELKQKVTEIQAENKKEIEALAEELKAEEAKQEEASRAYTSSIRSGNTKEAEKALKVKEAADRAIKILQDRIRVCETIPLVTESEYIGGYQSALKALDEYRGECEKRLIELCKQTEELKNEYLSTIEEANKIINQWQGDIYKYCDSMGMKKFGYPLLGEVKEYKNMELVYLVNRITESEFYKNYKEK